MKASLLALALCVLVMSVSQADDVPERHQGSGRVYDSEARISIVPPAEWRAFAGDKPHRLTFENGGGQSGNMNVLVGRAAQAPAEKFPDALKRQFAENLKEWKFVEDGFLEIDGTKAYFIVSRFVAQEGEKSAEMQNAQHFLPAHKGKSYVITFTTAPSRFEKSAKLFRESAASFRGD